MNERWISEPRCGVCYTAVSQGCECKQKFSEDFRNMLTLLDVEKIIEGSHIEGANFQVWELQRKFIADHITHKGTMLHINCANGFLLRSLQEWQPHNIDPYGIDKDKQGIDQAHIIFPRQQNRFTRVSYEQIADKTPEGYPDTFDYVLWDIDDRVLEQDISSKTTFFAKRARNLTNDGGVCMLGAYHPDEGVHETFIKQLRAKGLRIEVKKNTCARPERLYMIQQ